MRQFKEIFVFKIFILYCTFVSLCIKECLANALEKELTMTSSQKAALDKFRDRMLPLLPHDYMKEDIYLIRWLRVKDFDVPSAEIMLKENLMWRKENDMDNILSEDWSDFEKEYRVNVEGCDKDGRPVISLFVGDWDFRNAVVTGKAKRLMRYVDRLFEEGTVMVRGLQRLGHNVTQFVEIFDMANLNIVQHGCIQCIPMHIYGTQSYDKHFPLTVYRSFNINAPPYLYTLMTLVRPFQSPQTRDVIKVYGRDKGVWKKDLLQQIDPDNLSKYFGGTKERGWDFEDLRRDTSLYKCNKFGDLPSFNLDKNSELYKSV